MAMGEMAKVADDGSDALLEQAEAALERIEQINLKVKAQDTASPSGGGGFRIGGGGGF